MDLIARVAKHFEDSAHTKLNAVDAMSAPIAAAIETMFNCLINGGKILACGNGGSAGDAQHFAAELIGRFEAERQELAAIALTTDTSILTAVGNDYSFNQIFSRQVRGLGHAGDVLLALPALHGCVEAALLGTAAASGVMSAHDRRSTGTQTDDETMEWKANNHVPAQYKDKAHANFTAFNRRLLITGEAPSEEAKSAIESEVRKIEGVKDVYNELGIGPATPLSSRSNDSFITSKVKARLVNDQPELGNAMKVVTENGVVYVFGMLTQSEVERGIEIVRTTAGVQRVVKTSLITIIEAPKAQALDESAREDAAKTQGTVTPLPSGDQQPTTQAVN